MDAFSNGLSMLFEKMEMLSHLFTEMSKIFKERIETENKLNELKFQGKFENY